MLGRNRIGTYSCELRLNSSEVRQSQWPLREVRIVPVLECEQILPPIKIGVEQVLVALERSARNLVEIAQFVWINGQRAGHRPSEGEEDGGGENAVESEGVEGG